MTRRKTPLPPELPDRLRLLIAHRAGHPCPGNVAMAEALEVTLHALRRALIELEQAGDLQVQHTAWIGGVRRRMRVRFDNRWRPWTALTKRRAYTLTIMALDLLALAGDRHHLARVLAAGRF